MAVASRVQHAAMSRRMDRDRVQQSGLRIDPVMAAPPEYVAPKKPVSQMTKREMEAYYQTAGA